MQVALRPRESLDAVFLGSTRRSSRRSSPTPIRRSVRSETTTLDYQRFYLRYRRLLDDGASVEVVPFVGHDTSNLDAPSAPTRRRSTSRPGAGASARRTARAWPTPSTLTLGRRARRFERAASSGTGSLLIPPREGDITVFGQPPGGDTSTPTPGRQASSTSRPTSSPTSTSDRSPSRPALRVDGYLLQTSRQTPRVGRDALRSGSSSSQRRGRAAHLRAAPGDPAAVAPRRGGRLLAAARSRRPQRRLRQPHARHRDGRPRLARRVAPHHADALARDARLLQVDEPTSPSATRRPTPRLAEALLQEGVGRAYGVQLLLRQQPWHGFFGWVAYTHLAERAAGHARARAGGSSTTTSRTCSPSSRARSSALDGRPAASATRPGCRGRPSSAPSTTPRTTSTSRSSAPRTRSACRTSGSSTCASTGASPSARAARPRLRRGAQRHQPRERRGVHLQRRLHAAAGTDHGPAGHRRRRREGGAMRRAPRPRRGLVAAPRPRASRTSAPATRSSRRRAILAVRADPAEAAPGTAVTFTALVAEPGRARWPTPAIDWSFCTAPEPLTEDNVVSNACLDSSSLVAAGVGTHRHGHDPGERLLPLRPGDRRRRACAHATPTSTGGYYQPLRADLAGRRQRVRARPHPTATSPNADAAAATRVRRRLHSSNQNPHAPPADARRSTARRCR